MTSNLIDNLKEAFKNAQDMDHEKLKALAEEMIHYLVELEDALQSKEPEERAAAIHQALEVKELLEAQSEGIQESFTMSADEFREIMRAPSMFTDEEQATIVDISSHLDYNKKNKTKIKKLKPIHLS